MTCPHVPLVVREHVQVVMVVLVVFVVYRFVGLWGVGRIYGDGLVVFCVDVEGGGRCVGRVVTSSRVWGWVGGME